MSSKHNKKKSEKRNVMKREGKKIQKEEYKKNRRGFRDNKKERKIEKRNEDRKRESSIECNGQERYNTLKEVRFGTVQYSTVQYSCRGRKEGRKKRNGKERKILRICKRHSRSKFQQTMNVHLVTETEN